MTYAQVITEATSLSREERLQLIEVLASSLRGEATTRNADRASVEAKRQIAKRLDGVLKSSFGNLPQDWNWKDAKADALAGKYLQ